MNEDVKKLYNNTRRIMTTKAIALDDEESEKKRVNRGKKVRSWTIQRRSGETW